MKKEDKILIIIPSLTLGGAEKQALEYAKSLKRLGLTPIVLGIGREGEMLPKLKELEIDYENYSFADFFNSNKFKQLLFLLKFTFFVRSLKCKKGISFTYWPNVIFKLIARFVGIKAMYWNQRSVDDTISPVFWERLGNKFKVDYLANSKASAASILNRHQLKEGDIKIIYNVMDLSEKVTFDKKENGIHLVMVANFFHEKDHFTVLKAFKQLSNIGLKAKIILHFVGAAPGGSKRLLEVKAMAFDLGLCNDVIFHGVVNDTKQFLKKMDIGVLSTYSEGFSNAIMEYMDVGLPVVASAIGPNLEALTDVNQEFLFEVENVDELADKLELFILNENLRREIGGGNLEIAQKSFHIRNLDLALKRLLIDKNGASTSSASIKQ